MEWSQINKSESTDNLYLYLLLSVLKCILYASFFNFCDPSYEPRDRH